LLATSGQEWAELPPRGAVFDPSRRYRYRLWRRWAAGAPVLFVMLNPSTADAERDDPTIRRCVGFARAWGFAGMTVVNLFALRATDPARLRRARDPVGRDNDCHIAAAAAGAGTVVVAWGTHGELGARDRAVLALLAPHRPRCLGLTRGGHPRHPLYLPARTASRPFR
jgi:hypothetical protein